MLILSPWSEKSHCFLTTSKLVTYNISMIQKLGKTDRKVSLQKHYIYIYIISEQGQINKQTFDQELKSSLSTWHCMALHGIAWSIWILPTNMLYTCPEHMMSGSFSLHRQLHWSICGIVIQIFRTQNLFTGRRGTLRFNKNVPMYIYLTLWASNLWYSCVYPP